MAHHRRHETAPWPVAATLILVLTATCVIPKAEAETTSATPPDTTADTTKTTSPPNLEPPTDAGIENITTTTITVTWTNPNGTFDQIRVDCNTTNGANSDTKYVAGGAETATCVNLTSGTHYLVTVSNVLNGGAASAKPVTAVTYMNPPAGVRVGLITTTTIPVTWTDPSDNFDKIRVDCKTTNGKNNTQEVNGTIQKATCVNLTSGAYYTVNVSSVLNDGATPPASADPEAAITYPMPPHPVAIHNTTVDSIAVTWELPEGLNDGFKTVCVSDNDAAPDTVTVKKDSIGAVCSNLTAGALYNVTVTTLTTYENDTKEASAEPVLAVTVPMPADIEVDDLSTTALVVTIKCNPETKCTRFEVSTAETEPQTVDWTDGPQKVNITDLESDTLYEVNVTTISDYGADLTKRSENATAYSWTRPDIVRDLSAVPTGSRDINVSWKAPTNDPSPAMQYVLLVKGPSGCILRTNFVPPNVTPHPSDVACTKRTNESINISQIDIAYSVPGLTPYTNYTVEVVAINLANSSAPDTVMVLTDEDIPGVVSASSIKADAAFDSVALTWDSPVPENGVIAEYWIITCEVSENGEETWEKNDTAGPNRTAIIDGLEAVSNYSFQIAARTSAGWGPFSDSVYSKTRTGEPYPPSRVEAKAGGANALRVTWVLPPGARATGETVYYDVLATDSANTTFTRNVTVTGFDVRTVTIGGLHPYWVYNISVTARTEDVDLNQTYTASGPASNGTTGETTPGPVVSFTVKNQQPDNVCNQLTVQWAPPTAWDSHGVILSYTVNVTSVDQPTHPTLSQEYPADSERGDFIDVDPNNSNYTATIQAATSKGLGTAYSQMPVSTGACKPLDITNATAAEVIDSQTGQTQTSVIVPLSLSFLCDDTNGKLTFRGIIVAAKDMVGEDPHQGVWSPTLDKLNAAYGPWKDGYAAYRTTLTDWNPCDAGAPQGSRVKRATTNADTDKTTEYEVGAGGCGPDDYCNKPLAKDSQYNIKLAICTVTGCQVTSYPPIILKTDPSMAWIAAAVIIPVVIIVILIVLFIYLKRDNKWPFNEGTKGGREMQPIASGTDNPAFQDQVTQRPPPVHINDFEQHALMRSKDSDLIFAEEYKLIQESSPRHPKDAAEYPQNRIKNRFTNILPFDHSRVKLLPTDDEEGSDYINANYMPGYNSRREYIASQGPMASTQDDFWRMIWEQNVPLIVMLTQLEERGRERCAKYWPSDGEPVYFGDLQVQMRSESVLDTYVIRVFDVRLGAICRTIKQFHYMVWPDFGVPDDQDCLVTFVREVRSHVRPNFQGPLLIHCSAGVGRTGTLIAVDRLLQHICDHNTIDIFGVTMEMREYRCYMVQVEAQYIFIHKCITSAIRRGLHLNRRTTMVEDQPLYANTDMIENGGPIYENAPKGSPAGQGRDSPEPAPSLSSDSENATTATVEEAI